MKRSQYITFFRAYLDTIQNALHLTTSLLLTLLYSLNFEPPYDPMIVVMAGKTAGEQQSQPV